MAINKSAWKHPWKLSYQTVLHIGNYYCISDYTYFSINLMEQELNTENGYNEI